MLIKKNNLCIMEVFIWLENVGCFYGYFGVLVIVELNKRIGIYVMILLIIKEEN